MAGPSSEAVVEDDGMIQDRRQAITKPVPASRVVTKPIPQAATQDPLEFQLGQIRRRFNPKETKLVGNAMLDIEEGTSLLQFKMAPSDPDFPFEMTALEVSLSVPSSYPKLKPSLKVGNKDIPRGFALNIESGFRGLTEDKPDATLLELMKALDKNLEVFLSAPKVETVKIVTNKDTRHLADLPSRSVGLPSGSGIAASGDSSKFVETFTPVKPVKTFSTHQKADAAKRREVETRQLEARMGRLPLYKRSGDGIAYTIPIEPKKRSELSIGIQAIKIVQMFVPLLYPLQPCRIQLVGVAPEEAKPVEKGFEQKAIERQEVALMVHINYLAQNMHTLAKTVVEEKKIPPLQIQQLEPSENIITKGKHLEGHQDAERSHIQYITRPPEWDIIDQDDLSDTDTDDLYSYDTGDESSDKGGGVEVASTDQNSAPLPTQNQERGTAISFPFIELYGIELLEIAILNLTVKCERCKEITEVKELKDGVTKVESCKKCASPLHVGFRKDLVHAHAVRAGFLDLEGCVVGDLLPSTFIPTCSQCSAPYPSPGIVSVRGDTTSNVCRECHQKFTFLIPQIKFLRITSSHLPPAPAGRRKKETLGLVPGTELPRRGSAVVKRSTLATNAMTREKTTTMNGRIG
ncbi:hypothetical protein D0Z07_8031 [Hyphodiscus hymeniophilus]|uniref:CHY-type domain-containing protein n=1 Tax=Hyphodiscus hymeniophilus TaxID=353542 RepID=A0A9P6SKQ4_9HELO|nr:hypothetical protein D0Z07_8031 [Hyphodiscus hymeniophilus]